MDRLIECVWGACGHYDDGSLPGRSNGHTCTTTQPTGNSHPDVLCVQLNFYKKKKIIMT